MAGQLVHRGPDDEGFYVDPQGRCGLGFRRLSIIDLATGNQPQSNESGSVWVVFNGEIYNFRELRADLERAGGRFRTSGDAEVIAHLYERDGPACFARLAGMFAIALWDAREGVLHLARDRLGKKPLVYAERDGRLYFASEAKAILALPGWPRVIDAPSLHRYLVFQYVPAPYSIFRGISKLVPGCRGSVRAGEPGALTQTRYWAPPRPGVGGATRGRRDVRAALSDLDRLLTGAVERRLIADVPLGAFLSGGVDSSIVVAMMRRLGVSPLRTFSIGFQDARYDETAFARRVAARFGTEHHELTVTPRAVEVLDKLAWHYDEPFADSSAIPTFYLAQHTRSFVTVALTGDGGDECFAGYERYRAMQWAARAARLPRAVRGGLSRLARGIPHGRARTFGNRLFRFLSVLAQPPIERYLSWVCVFDPRELVASYRSEFAERVRAEEPAEWFRAAFGDGRQGPADGNYADVVTYLPYDLLTKVDIASMACSLECRSPFLDHELLEFALGLPLRLKLRGRGGKWLLKRWARDVLPPEVLNRSKMGFGVPVGEWFRRELRSVLEERLLTDRSLSRQVFRPGVLERLVREHVSGRANHEHRLWALLMLETWAATWCRSL